MSLTDPRSPLYDPLGRYSKEEAEFRLLQRKVKELQVFCDSEKRKFMQEFILNCAKTNRANEGRSFSGAHIATEASKAWNTMLEILKKEEDK